MRRVLSAALVAALLLPVVPAHGAAGDLDPSFGGDGLAFATFKDGGQGFTGARGADGTLVVAGHSGLKLAVARFLPDGSLDPAFGGGDGRVLYAVGEGYAQANDVLVMDDGRTLIAAYAVVNGRPAIHVLRLRADGTRDRSFSGDGVAATTFGVPATAGGLTLQPDGAVVVIGSAGAGAVVLRYRTDGTPDPSFSGDGVFAFDVGLAAPDEGVDVALAPEGDLAIVGTSDDDSGIFTGRLNADGSFDGGFGGDGWSIARGLGEEVTASAVAVRPSGQVVVGGTVAPTGGTCCQMIVVLYGLAGGRVATFGGGDGITMLRPAAGSARLSALALTIDGGVVAVGGGGESPEQQDLVVARLGSDGAPDVSFGGGDGLAVVVRKGEEAGFGLGLEPDGDVLVAGTRYALGTYRFLGARVQGS
jgi:uncharacterized delta-60 repeat protein